jgi:2-oxoglutarate/2-oxoacid ferredoxin oxidoreductase subunit beta
MKLDTYVENTWCPGCRNFVILTAFKNAISSLVKNGLLKESIVVVGGIGCNSKIIDYLNLNSFSSLHGRPIISAEGIKLGNPKLKVVVFIGDGGCYNEGISHLIHAAKRNIDITVLVHNNSTFALTAGQFTATSPEGFKGRSAPEGNVEKPLNPLKLVLASNGTFVARGYAMRMDHLTNLIIQAINHSGFSFVDILQPCISFFDTTLFYNQKIYEIEEKNLDSPKEALKKIEEWDYKEMNSSKKIPIGIFYKIQKPSYCKKHLGNLNPSQRKKKIKIVI